MAAPPLVKLAVLIDADNAQPALAGSLLAEIAHYGTPFAKRAYGDWTGTRLKGWKEQLLVHSIQPIQQFAYTQGKTATDAAMIIDAMDLLYTKRFDAFCLVSSDCGFTRLASRIRESGIVVYGCGDRDTPRPFIAACSKFIFVENAAPVEEPAPPRSNQSTAVLAEASHGVDNWRLTETWLRDAVEATSGDDGWANLAVVGGLVSKRHPDFDPRSHGYAKLSEMIQDLGIFEVTSRFPAPGKTAVMYAREKRT
ncbi:hypothetical protein HIM_08258 [Hirsutella minnesotensis 3608]|uniref:HTH OST-type domain-containing protein n=1 Tax=Hirsutella minnesotensis 3608 TaxID=1043627 RepID=A0A0F7ZYE5_9HYPO|nr:hypothetical protein HIM_08258 [Hirsutella minnesotensis 3608]